MATARQHMDSDREPGRGCVIPDKSLARAACPESLAPSSAAVPSFRTEFEQFLGFAWIWQQLRWAQGVWELFSSCRSSCARTIPSPLAGTSVLFPRCWRTVLAW